MGALGVPPLPCHRILFFYAPNSALIATVLPQQQLRCRASPVICDIASPRRGLSAHTSSLKILYRCRDKLFSKHTIDLFLLTDFTLYSSYNRIFTKVKHLAELIFFAEKTQTCQPLGVPCRDIWRKMLGNLYKNWEIFKSTLWILFRLTLTNLIIFTQIKFKH